MAPSKKTAPVKAKVVRKRHDYDTVTKAVDAIKGGLSFRKASATFGIPLGTLVDKVKGRRPLHTEKNTSSLLTPGEEQKLVEWLIALAGSGFGRTVDDLRMTAKRLIDLRREKEGSPSSATSEDSTPSRAWAYHFVKRHPQLTKRSPVSLGKERAVICSDAVRGWFEELRSCCDAIDPELLKSPQRLFNADETGFSFDPKSRKVIAQKGAKHVYKVTANSKKQVTVLACTSAAGQYLPPTLIYPYKRVPTKNLLADFPGALIQASDNGWITAPIFLKWLEECFIPAVKPLPKPVLLLVDGHPSHTSMVEITEICLENQVMLFCLLPHASHLIQPLDQALFGSLKPAWGEASRQHMFHTGEGVGLDSFAGVFRRAWEKSATKEMAEKSFKAAGIYPFNPERVLLAGNPINITPTFFPSIPSDDPDPASPSNVVPTSFQQIPSSNASFPSSLQEHTGLLSSPAPPTSPSFTLSETVKAMTAEQLSALRAYTVFIQEEIGSRKSKDFLDRLASTQPQPAGDHEFQAFHHHVKNLTEAFKRKTPEKVALTQEDILKLPQFHSSKGCRNNKKTPTIPRLISSEEWRSLQKKKILDNEEAERKKKEKRELAREKKRHQQEEKEAQKRRKEEALVEKKKKKEEMQAKKENAKRKRELEKLKIKMKKGKRPSYGSSSDSDDEIMDMVMSDMGDEDEVGVSENDDKSAGCGTVGEPSILWIQCEQCLLWWHSRCTNLKDLNEEELKKAPFACC
ncbi:tigger transposable element-derived protein 6-like protein [Plakobranchus ocellatus]|uniref:Tigger transposable element-derived protein 6-like protein n=1 Tax=Plakobranchus ocellatus TaxID=259542 RepID=A0AAV4DJL1_9GAST|nr:tigger transposable element-derived protein 6-like protein [Plakobranchus ocellatus]